MSTLSFMDLPPKLIVVIAGYLEPVDVACLALTCSRLYECQALRMIWKPSLTAFHHFRETTILDQSCLPLLERLLEELPEMTICPYCRKLHPQRRTPKICRDWELWTSCPRATTGMWLHFGEWEYHLQFEDVYNVMRRHRLGLLYGDALESIAVSTDWQPGRWDYGLHLEGYRPEPGFTRRGWMQKLDVVPKIVGDLLVFSTVQRMLFSPDLRESLRTRGIGGHVFTQCQHWNWNAGHKTRKSYTPVSSVIEPALEMLSRTPEAGSKRPTTIIPNMCKCCLCLTEYRVTVWDHGLLGIEVALSTWTNLGSCRDSSSPGWLVAAHHECDLYSTDDIRRAHRDAFRTHQYVRAFAPDLVIQCKTAIDHPSFLDIFGKACQINIPSIVSDVLERPCQNQTSKPPSYAVVTREHRHDNVESDGFIEKFTAQTRSRRWFFRKIITSVVKGTDRVRSLWKRTWDS